MNRANDEGNSHQKDVYTSEFRLLEKAKKVSQNKSLTQKELLNEYNTLQKEYFKLLKTTIKINRISDVNQRKLIRMLQLENENLRLEQMVTERTEEIEKKNRLLREQSEKLKELDRVKSRFLTNISHEFRTPLTLIMGPLEQMISQCQPDEESQNRHKKYVMMLRNAQRLLRLINQLLELSKLDSGRMKLKACETDIVSFINVMVGSFQALADKNELAIDFHIGNPQEKKRLYIDRRKIEDVLHNILINAVKFTPPGGQILITLKETLKSEPGFPCGWIEIAISDTGPGIPAAQVPLIFNRFYESGNTSERRQKGSGIGMALAKELVELHHGTIRVNSREGNGSTFTVRLPRDKRHLSPDQLEQQHIDRDTDTSSELAAFESTIDTEPTPSVDCLENIPTESDPQTLPIILVVDDSTDMRSYIKSGLQPAYQVIEASNGKEGIRLAQKYIPDLIVSDVVMPEADGYQLCQTLKHHRDTSHIPIILLTVKASEDSIVKGLGTGADDYLTKPFNLAILNARIDNLIQLRRQLQQSLHREMSCKPREMPVSSYDKEFLRDLKTTIDQNLSDPDFNVEALCKKLYISRPTLYRKIQALSNETPTDFIRTYRLKRAMQLLESGFGSVTEVAFEVGFSSRSYFTKCFKDQFHQLPSEFNSCENND